MYDTVYANESLTLVQRSIDLSLSRVGHLAGFRPKKKERGWGVNGPSAILE